MKHEHFYSLLAHAHFCLTSVSQTCVRMTYTSRRPRRPTTGPSSSASRSPPSRRASAGARRPWSPPVCSEPLRGPARVVKEDEDAGTSENERQPILSSFDSRRVHFFITETSKRKQERPHECKLKWPIDKPTSLP